MMHSPTQAARIAAVWLFFIVMTANLSACGIRGPLVLPEPEPAVPAQPAGSTAAK
jgi:predicted small lipoprotein YifL